MKVLVRWWEEMAMEVETDDPYTLECGLPDEDLSESECLGTKDWGWEPLNNPNGESHPLKP